MLTIFTPCWGPKHLALLESALGRCFNWPENYRVVKDAKWVFMTDRESFQPLGDAAARVLPNATREVIVHEFLGKHGGSTGAKMVDALSKIMRDCVESKSPMLMATPDFVFGEGTLKTFTDIGKQEGVCVAVPHIRVNPSFLENLDRVRHYWGVPKNSQLMYLAWRHAHKAWTSSEIDQGAPGAYRGGVSWRMVSPTIALVQHRLPSPFYVNFTKTDLNFFSVVPNREFGAWDHRWPSLLIEMQRLRLIGSSDAAMLAEVTDEDMNVPPEDVFDPKEPDHFIIDELHTRIQRQFVSVFRGNS